MVCFSDTSVRILTPIGGWLEDSNIALGAGGGKRRTSYNLLHTLARSIARKPFLHNPTQLKPGERTNPTPLAGGPVSPTAPQRWPCSAARARGSGGAPCAARYAAGRSPRRDAPTPRPSAGVRALSFSGRKDQLGVWELGCSLQCANLRGLAVELIHALHNLGQILQLLLQIRPPQIVVPPTPQPKPWLDPIKSARGAHPANPGPHRSRPPAGVRQLPADWTYQPRSSRARKREHDGHSWRPQARCSAPGSGHSRLTKGGRLDLADLNVQPPPLPLAM